MSIMRCAMKKQKSDSNFRKNLIKIIMPIAFGQFMLALVNASDALMLGWLSQDALSAVVSLVFSVLCFIIPDYIMRLLTNNAVLQAQGAIYLKIISVTYVIKGISQIELCIFKNTERTFKSSLISSACVVFNIVLNVALIFGLSVFPRLEIAGALCRISVIFGIASGLFIAAIIPFVLRITNLSEQADFYLTGMMLMCIYYMVGKSVNCTTVGGIFCAGGDSRFGFLCDTVTLWCVTVPLGAIAAFWLKLPVLWVYFILSLDEILKLPFVYRRYKKYKWIKDLTVKEDLS